MRIKTPAKIAIVASLALTMMVSCAQAGASTPGVSTIAQNGFGDHNNSYAWSMYWFKGKLYVGTGRDEECMEGATVERYEPGSGAYTTNPSPNLQCPKNPFSMHLRAEIWQYTPPGTKTVPARKVSRRQGVTTIVTTKGNIKITVTKTRTTTTTSRTRVPVSTSGHWKEVYVAPTESNPMEKYKAIGRDLAYRGMTAMTDPTTHKQALFAGAVTPDEIAPPLLTSHPPGLMRSYDGVHWSFVHLPAIKVHYPTPLSRPMGFRSLLVWRGNLYATATPDLTGDGVLVEITHPFSKHPGMKQVSPPNQDIFEVQKFDGDLYTGTGSSTTGYGVYKTNGRHDGRYLRFKPIVTDGAGRGAAVTSVVSMHVYRGRLYVGSSGWYNRNSIPISEMIRIAPNDEWALVVGNPRTLKNGRTMNPISGQYDGFFNPFTAHFWRMANQGGGMFIGTNDWSYLVQADKSYAFLDSMLTGELGFDIWGTCNGTDYFAVTRDAFTGDEYNFGGRNLVTDGPKGNDLYIGSANQAQGASIFDDHLQSCQSLVHEPDALARPAALMTDHAAAGGTLVSWKPTAGATSYTVERAAFTSATISVQPGLTVNGVHFDSGDPSVVAPGTPGSIAATLTVPGEFTPVAQTDEPYYVDSDPGKYLYEVVATNSLGEDSLASNSEITPTGAPPTFASAADAVSSPSAAGATIARAQDSAPARLISAAQAAFATGHHSVAFADLARVQRLAARGDNDNLVAVAAGLERRLQYATLTGAR